MLVSILKRDKLEMDEIDIWKYVIQWGTGQNEELGKNISEWKKDDFKKLKNILNDIIQLIRFSEISNENFYDKVNPYKKIFDKNIYEKLLRYYFTKKWQPELPFQKGSRKETGKLVGGYNPVCWNLKEKSPDDPYWIGTDESFIFKIDENRLDNSILSKVKKPKHAVFLYEQNFDFTWDSIEFHKVIISFNI